MITGKIYENRSEFFSDFTTQLICGYLFVEVRVNNNLVIKFPLPEVTDGNEVAVRLQNILNQCNVSEHQVMVEYTPE